MATDVAVHGYFFRLALGGNPGSHSPAPFAHERCRTQEMGPGGRLYVHTRGASRETAAAFLRAAARVGSPGMAPPASAKTYAMCHRYIRRTKKWLAAGIAPVWVFTRGASGAGGAA